MEKFSFNLKDKLNLDDLYNTFFGLSQNERILAITGVVVVVILLIVLPISCASSTLSGLEQQIINHEKNVEKISEKIQEYKTLDDRLKDIQKKVKPAGSVKLSSLLDGLSSKAGVTIDSMKEKESPGESGFKEIKVAVKVSKVTLHQVVDFFYGIESDPTLNMKVISLTMRPRYDDKQLFDLNFDVATLVADNK